LALRIWTRSDRFKLQLQSRTLFRSTNLSIASSRSELGLIFRLSYGNKLRKRRNRRSDRAAAASHPVLHFSPFPAANVALRDACPRAAFSLMRPAINVD
jgi:hypothetical protein